MRVFIFYICILVSMCVTVCILNELIEIEIIFVFCHWGGIDLPKGFLH